MSKLPGTPKHPNSGRKRDPVLARLLESVDRYVIPECCSSPGFVYMLYAEQVGRVKIGKSKGRTIRPSDIQSMCPVPLALLAMGRNAEHMERILHRKFDACRLHCEWFEAEPVIEWLHGIPATRCFSCYELETMLATTRENIRRLTSPLTALDEVA